MGDVIPIRPASADWRLSLELGLRTHGAAAADLALIGVEADQWRAAARAVARQLARPVRTGVDADGLSVWAALSDWPRTDDERAVTEADQRQVVRAIADLT